MNDLNRTHAHSTTNQRLADCTYNAAPKRRRLFSTTVPEARRMEVRRRKQLQVSHNAVRLLNEHTLRATQTPLKFPPLPGDPPVWAKHTP